MKIVLFEDSRAENLAPLTTARPAFALSMGGTTLLDALRRLAPEASVSWIVRGHLRETASLRHADGRESAPLPVIGERALMLNAAMAPKLRALKILIEKAGSSGSFCVGMESPQGRRVAAAAFRDLPFSVAGSTSERVAEDLAERTFDEYLKADARLLHWPHEIVGEHADIFRENLQGLLALEPLEGEAPWRALEGRPGVFARGNVFVHASAVADAEGEEGPILLDSGAKVGPMAYLRGPLLIGPGASVAEHASVKGNAQIGARCKVGGEVHSTIMEPFSNKGHHGFLGHAWVGSWVNLGAGTSNSNLKNTYGEVRAEYGGETVGTGRQFFGCLLGDYAKTAINASIYTGKTVGVASCVYGTAGANVPSFCNYAKSVNGQAAEFGLEAALSAQKRMFARRGLERTEADERLMRELHRRAQAERTLSAEPLAF